VILLSLLLVSTLFIGYFVSAQVPNELRDGEKWFLIATGLLTIPLFWFLPWWHVIMVAGALLIGWFPALVGFGSLLFANGVTALMIVAILGFLVGTRWRVEERPFSYLCVGAGVMLLLVLLL
jgi:hypothetical protein